MDGLQPARRNVSVLRYEEVIIEMRNTDWIRLRRRLETLKKQRKDFAGIGWAFTGAAISAGFSMLAWAPTFESFREDQILEFAWVWPTLIIAASASVILAVLAFIGSRIFAVAAGATASELCDDMDAIYDVRSLAGLISN